MIIWLQLVLLIFSIAHHCVIMSCWNYYTAISSDNSFGRYCRLSDFTTIVLTLIHNVFIWVVCDAEGMLKDIYCHSLHMLLVNTHGVEVSASWSWICCPGMRITVDVVRGMHTEGADCDVDLLRAAELPGLTDDRADADWFAVTQSTASDMTFMLLWRTPAWTFCCIAAFNLCQQQQQHQNVEHSDGQPIKNLVKLN